MAVVKKYISSFVLAAVAVVAVLVFYAPMFAYREGMLIFMSGADFFIETCLRPGGLSDYVGFFIGQFFMYAAPTALILAVILVAIQLTIRNIAKTRCDDSWADLLGTAGALAVMVAALDDNTMFGGIVAVMLATMAALVGKITKNVVVLALIVPVVYWIAGGWCCIIYIVGVAVCIDRPKNVISLGINGLVLTLTWLLTKKIMQADSLADTFTGVDTNNDNAAWFGAIAVVCACLALSLVKITLKNRIAKTALHVVAFAVAISLIYRGYNTSRMFDYKIDRMVRLKQWGRIVETAANNKYATFMSQCYLNLALDELGIMDSKMFSFRQLGLEGLLTSDIDSYDKSLCNSEIYFRLGLLNTSERLAIDAMESNDNHIKSARQYKRLAEINIIRDNKPLAMRYLKKLQRTMFYSAWADRAVQYLYDPTHTEALADWKIKPLDMERDFFFPEKHKTELMVNLLANNPTNRRVFNYYVGCLLLTRDIPKMYRLLKYYRPEGELGVHVYEATLLYLFNNDKAEFEKAMSQPNDLTARFEKFGNFMASPESKNVEKAHQLFGNTYWYYYYFEK